MTDERIIVISFTENEVKDILKYIEYAQNVEQNYYPPTTDSEHLNQLMFGRLRKRFESYK